MKTVDNQDEFNAALAAAGDKLVLVDFFATWCGPCRMISPKLEALEKVYTEVVFIKVDVDEVEDVAQEYEISAMPTFKYFKNTKLVGEVVGASMEKIEEKIKELK